MRSHLAIGLMFVVACSKPDATTQDRGSAAVAAAPETASSAPAPTAAPAKSIRWMWITAMGGPYLAYYYVDRTAGPSAKGAHVSDPPTAAELEKVITTPDHTFRDPVGTGAHMLTAAEVAAAKLPDRPAWLDIFEPPGTPAPPIPRTAETGRPRRQGTTYIVQYACGRTAGGYQIIQGGETVDVGTRKNERGHKRVVVSDAGVLDKHAAITNAEALTIEPVPGAALTVNGTPVTAATKLAIDDRIDIAKTTLIIRSEGFQGPVGPDPSCPGVKEAVWIGDGCFMYGSSAQQFLGGQTTVIGTDEPERVGLPPELRMTPPVRVELTNRDGKVEFRALDPKHLPKVKGKRLAKGTLHAGDSIEVGDRVFAISADQRRSVFAKTPMPICPEAKVKAARDKAKASRPRHR